MLNSQPHHVAHPISDNYAPGKWGWYHAVASWDPSQTRKFSLPKWPYSLADVPKSMVELRGCWLMQGLFPDVWYLSTYCAFRGNIVAWLCMNWWKIIRSGELKSGWCLVKIKQATVFWLPREYKAWRYKYGGLVGDKNRAEALIANYIKIMAVTAECACSGHALLKKGLQYKNSVENLLRRNKKIVWPVV